MTAEVEDVKTLGKAAILSDGISIGKSGQLKSAGSNFLGPLYVRYLDHVIFKNLEDPAAEAVERETIGWVKEQNDQLLLLEYDRAIPGKMSVSGVNGVVILKNCILEMRGIPLQKNSYWNLNLATTKSNPEYALQTKKRKTQPRTTKGKDKNQCNR